jgi:hypothetical protein
MTFTRTDGDHHKREWQSRCGFCQRPFTEWQRFCHKIALHEAPLTYTFAPAMKEGVEDLCPVTLVLIVGEAP